MKAVSNFVKEQDQLGQGVSLNYRGSTGFGTILGGCCSMFYSIVFAVFIVIQLYAWMFEPYYSESINVAYLDRASAQVYDVPLD